MDLNVYNELKQLIETMTRTGAPSLHQGHLKRIKQICKSCDAYVERAFDLLMTQLTKPHSEIRLSAFQITNELFLRSHLFRELQISKFQQLLEVTIETDADQPLPPPYPAASQLKQQTLLAIRQWHDKFGSSYPKLKLGYEFLKYSKKVDFDSLVARSEGEQRRQEEEERRMKLLIEQRLATVQKEIKDITPDIQHCLTEIETCFNLLLPRMDTWDTDFFPTEPTPNNDPSSGSHNDSSSDDEEEEWIEVAGPSSGLEGHGVAGREFSLTITLPQGKNSLLLAEDEDNQSIFETLRGSYVLCTNSYLPSVNKWLQMLTRCGQDDDLKQVIELKQRLLQAQEKYEELNIVPTEKPSDETQCSPKGKSGKIRNAPVKFSMETGGKKPEKSPKVSLDPTSMEAQLLALKQKQKMMENESGKEQAETKNSSDDPCSWKTALLSQAPVVQFDTDLYEWGYPDCTPSVLQFESLHKFWSGANETEVIVNEERQAAMRHRKITFEGKFEPVKWACRAPLPSGKLCPRRDRVKCPFHGPIVARDEQGRVINSETQNVAQHETQANPRAEDAVSWEDIEEEVSTATGQPQWRPKKKGKKRKAEESTEGLTNIKAKKNSARSRLEKKILNKRSLKRVADAMDRINEKRYQQKFSSSFKYALSK